ncbi:larval cuticle protein A2B-like [Frankliniella occidentalis]|uniref:Larval cuticle protein A2B-like n=1 Tax=Frankliniella occidentalis TaxID=133901 RepID=A0A9C6TSH9_FRAOC|nr:larval cuticle protein A2B-like [Frankliniella occidentalis]
MAMLKVLSVAVGVLAVARAGVVPQPLAYAGYAEHGHPVIYAEPAAPAPYAVPAEHADHVSYAPAEHAAPVSYVADAPVAYAAAAPVAPVTYTAAAPIALAAKSLDYDPHPEYKFSYDVQDDLTGDSKSQVESRSGDVVKGSYSVDEPDGTRRIVDYTADDVNGFNAVVRKEAQAPKYVVQPVHYAPAPGLVHYASSAATYHRR